MRARRSIVIGGGLLAALALGGYGAPHGDGPSGGDRRGLRERVARLRAEAELLQVDHDSAKAELSEISKRAGHVEFLRGTKALTPVGLAAEYLKALTGIADADDSMVRAHLMALAEGGKDAERKLYDDAEEDIKQLDDKLQAGVAHLKDEFIKLAINLNEKRLDLAEAERRYDESR